MTRFMRAPTKYSNLMRLQLGEIYLEYRDRGMQLTGKQFHGLVLGMGFDPKPSLSLCASLKAQIEKHEAHKSAYEKWLDSPFSLGALFNPPPAPAPTIGQVADLISSKIVAKLKELNA